MSCIVCFVYPRQPEPQGDFSSLICPTCEAEGYEEDPSCRRDRCYYTPDGDLVQCDDCAHDAYDASQERAFSSYHGASTPQTPSEHMHKAHMDKLRE